MFSTEWQIATNPKSFNLLVGILYILRGELLTLQALHNRPPAPSTGTCPANLGVLESRWEQGAEGNELNLMCDLILLI